MRFILILLFSSISISNSVLAQDDEVKSIPVTMQLLSKKLVTRELTASAQTVPLNKATIASENTAIVNKIHADVGQIIEQGQILLELENTDYYLSLKQAQALLTSNQAQIKQAKLRLKRAEELIEKNFIAKDDLLARITDLDVLNAEKRRLEIGFEQAQRALNKTIIKAPFDGVVVKRYANVGSLVTIGQLLFDFVQTQNPEVEADIPVHLTPSLSMADQIYFESSEQSYDLKLKILSPYVDPISAIQKARFVFVNRVKAKIGSSGQLIWKIKDGLIPADLIVNRNGVLGVFIASGNQARFKALTGAQEGRPVATDLSENTMIIVGGRDRLNDGDRISIKP